MIITTFTTEDFELVNSEYLRNSPRKRFDSNKDVDNHIAKVAGLCAEISIHKSIGLDWKFSFDSSDISIGGKEWQIKSRYESGPGNPPKKKMFTISHKSDYSNIAGFIFSKVHINADMSGRVETYPHAYDRYYIEGNGHEFRTYGRMIKENFLHESVCDDKYKIDLKEELLITFSK